MTTLDDALDQLPLVAILRGLLPARAVETGEMLVAAGFRVIEVPLNSPQPLSSIERLAAALGDRVIIGAGTVLRSGDINEVARAGGRLIVMPHANVNLIRQADHLGLFCMPGVATRPRRLPPSRPAPMRSRCFRRKPCRPRWSRLGAP